jgi:hypothetical protein
MSMPPALANHIRNTERGISPNSFSTIPYGSKLAKGLVQAAEATLYGSFSQPGIELFRV